MFRYILIGILCGFAISCQSNCEESAPLPLSFNLQFVDKDGNDVYYKKTEKIDSLKAFYKYNRKKQFVSLRATLQKEDSTQYKIDMMPLLRKAYEFRLDTVFLSIKSTDVDTVLVHIVKQESECYSTIYRFEKLVFNGKKLSGTDNLYKIEK
ncbi:MAG: hypothetical protein KGV44_13415 [Flavobacteriaceae bacterium]|nr:hypothetical protein [Flavobacteriaceae bacterium]